MEKLDVRLVSSPAERQVFLTFPWRIYKHDPLWVPPILADRQKSIDPDRGVWFKRGTADFFIAWRGDRAVGTICAAEDIKGNSDTGKRDCVFGFFECENNIETASALIETVANWARSRELNCLLGPYNLDYEDAYGFLIEGRDRPPVILCGHTPEYYPQLFNAIGGFVPAHGDNLAFAIEIDPKSESIARLFRLEQRAKQKPGYSVRCADFKHWEEEVDRVFELINPALKHLPGFIPWQREALRELLAPFVELADPDLILFAEVNGQSVGFFPAIPNFNEILIHANGLRFPWDKIKALLYSKIIRPRCAAIKSVLMLPEYWGSGAAVLLFAEMARQLIRKGYTWADLSLTSDDNPRTPQLAAHIGAHIYKRYRAYRKHL